MLTAQFKMQVALSDLNVTLMELGSTVLPVVVPTAKAFVSVVQDMAGAVGIVLNPIAAFNQGLKSLQQPLFDLLRSTDVTSETIVGLGRDAKMSNTEIEDWGKQIGLTDKEISQAFLNAGDSAENFALVSIPLAVSVNDTFVDLANVVGDVGEEVKGAAEVMVDSLGDVEQQADDARSALVGMFRETTAEEAAAEAALAGLKVEGGRLEAKIDDLTGAEQARLDLLNSELIPAQQDIIVLMRLEKDAVEADALALDRSLPSHDDWIRRVPNRGDVVSDLDFRIRGLPKSLTVDIGVKLTGQEILRSLLVGPQIARQHGGPFSARQAVLVGERGPEVAVFNQPGTVIPNNQLGGGGGGGGVSINLHIETLIGGEDAAAELADLLMPHIRRAVA